ncbi:MAG: HAD family hydrolase [Candidatus Saccharicenans sp.]|uniref:HAD family hydrolase n=1 Tax=Candidatus Saccharicenans sp. TaxID=2819258 RepID=UPI004049F9C1
MIICFDVDGVLVEVGSSYYRALSETVSYFLRQPVDSRLLLHLKFRLNLNNDWDATLAGILFYRSGMEPEEFVRQLAPGPPDFRKFYARAAEEKIELPDYNRLIEKFEALYRKYRPLETLNISPATLAEIKSLAGFLAVITGRTREDLDYTFNKFSLYKFFEVIIAEDDLPSVETRKPSSYPLKLLFEKSGYSAPACYIGDTLADSQMLENFNREDGRKVFFILYKNDLNSGVKADFYVENEKELLQLVKNFTQSKDFS